LTMAQDTVTGAFEGVVSDSQTGAALKGALVEIVNQQTSLIYTLRTDYRGRFYQGRPGPTRYFRIKPSASPKGQVAEVLTLLVSSQPLIDANQLSATAITLSREQVESWEKQWATPATKFEMEGGAGQTMTEKEQKAYTDDAALTQADPAPQTIYRLAIKPDDAPVIRLPLRFTQTKVGGLTNVKPR
jgi:hypothetical protein